MLGWLYFCSQHHLLLVREAEITAKGSAISLICASLEIVRCQHLTTIDANALFTSCVCLVLRHYSPCGFTHLVLSMLSIEFITFLCLHSCWAIWSSLLCCKFVMLCSPDFWAHWYISASVRAWVFHCQPVGYCLASIQPLWTCGETQSIEWSGMIFMKLY